MRLLRIGILVLSLVATVPALAAPSFEQARENYRSSEAVLLDRSGETLQELRMDPEGRRVGWVPLERISQALPAVVIGAEDKRFFTHHGVDWAALGGALWSHFTGGHRGGSTITMQLASLLHPELHGKRAGRTLEQKWRQMQEAWELERTWTKAQILEAYLNLATFRGELQGVLAASRALFGKEPHGLTEGEAVVLAALLRGPNAPMKHLTQRACSLGRHLDIQAGCDLLGSLIRRTLSVPPVPRPAVALAPHAARRLLARDMAQTIPAHPFWSTLDRPVQTFAREVLKEQLLSVGSQNVHDGALLVVDNRSGEVLAYVGGNGEFSSARFVDGVIARRQAGSTLKPFLYALVFDQRLLTPASLVEDSPMDLAVGTGVYRPKNYDGQFRGLVSTRTALASSLNIPAVRTLNLVGVEAFLRELRRLGLSDLEEGAEFYGPALALGTAEVTLWNLVNAFRTLANGGRWSELKLTLDQNPQAAARRVFSQEAAFLVSHILSDRGARNEAFGLENPLATPFWSAVKTGTSKDMRDNWCIGYSSRYTVGVWVGNLSGDPMWDVSGVTGAAPVWRAIMEWLHRAEPSVPVPPPAGVVSRVVRAAGSPQSTREWFLRGTEPNTSDMVPSPPNAKIVYPVSDMLVSLDPDIPEEQQRVFFEAQPRSDRLHLVLDGTEVGTADTLVGWRPRAGTHTLILLDEWKDVVDTVTFKVRGGRIAMVVADKVQSSE